MLFKTPLFLPHPRSPFLPIIAVGAGICNSANVAVLEVASSRGGRAGREGRARVVSLRAPGPGASQRGPHWAPRCPVPGKGGYEALMADPRAASIPSLGRPSHLEAK